MIVERHPKPNEVVGGSYPGRKISSPLDRKTSLVARAFCVPKNKTNVVASKTMFEFGHDPLRPKWG
jgi:hypothetical protein